MTSSRLGLSDMRRLQIFQPVDSDTENDALKAAQSLIRTLYPPADSPEHLKLDGLAVDIVQQCKRILREPEKSQAMHAIKVLGALISTTGMFRVHSSSAGYILIPHSRYPSIRSLRGHRPSYHALQKPG